MGMLFTRPALLSQCMVTIKELGDAVQRRLAGGWAGVGRRKGMFQIGQEVRRSREHGSDQGVNPVLSK